MTSEVRLSSLLLARMLLYSGGRFGMIARVAGLFGIAAGVKL